MKRVISKIISVVFALAVLIGCSSENNTIDDVFEQVENGAFLRTVETVSSSFNLFDTSSSFQVVVEEQDHENGALLSQLNKYISFTDVTDDGTDYSKAEVAVGTVAASEFTTSQYGLPTTTVSVTLAEALAALGLSEGQYNGGDSFNIRLELVLTDGRTYSAADANGNVAALGGYYSSPYAYSAALVCPTSLEGTHAFVGSMLVAGNNPGACPVGTVTGTVTWTNQGGGTYLTSDLGFGQYESSCWNDAPASSAGATFVDACNIITSGGTDQYGLVYTWTIVSVNGPELTIDWVNDYADSGRAVITREGGADWPPLVTN